jgi:hypothetical protein
MKQDGVATRDEGPTRFRERSRHRAIGTDLRSGDGGATGGEGVTRARIGAKQREAATRTGRMWMRRQEETVRYGVAMR